MKNNRNVGYQLCMTSMTASAKDYQFNTMLWAISVESYYLGIRHNKVLLPPILHEHGYTNMDMICWHVTNS